MGGKLEGTIDRSWLDSESNGSEELTLFIFPRSVHHYSSISIGLQVSVIIAHGRLT